MDRLQSQLIVSCQPQADEAFYDHAFVSGMAQGALLGGAAGLRLNSPDSISYVRQQVGAAVPLIGLWKQQRPDSEVYITPTLASAWAVVEAGADLVALDATSRPRPNRESLAFIVEQLKAKGIALMADISTFAEGLHAAQLGFDCISTTLSGYTSDSPQKSEPDFDLLTELVKHVNVPVIMEGRVSTPADVRRALALGAWAVVVGSAITRPQWITAQFCRALPHVSH